MFFPKAKLILFFLCLFGISCLHAQVAVGTNNTPANQSAMLDVQSTNKGLLFPRMTTDQRRAILNPAAGLVVYDIDKQGLYLHNGSIWKALALSDPSFSPSVTATGIDALDGATGDGLGINVKISGNYAIAGAYNDDINANADQGSVYVYKFENGNWTQVQKLVANDGAAGDFFGGGIAIDSNYIFIGAYNDDIGENINQGSVYVFKLINGIWTQVQKVTGSNASTGDIFGGYIYMSKGTAVVAASLDDIGAATDAGSAYIFKLNDSTGLWNETQKIYPNDGTSGDNFANCIYISDDKIILTCIYDDVNGTYRRGSAYIFTNQNNTWIQTAKIVAPDGANNDNFGTNAAIQGDYALIGAYAVDGTFGNQGACYLYKLESNVWVHKQKFSPTDATGSGFFGNSVSLQNNIASIGSHGVNGLQGAVYVYQLNPATNTMSQIQKITPVDGASNDYFGFSSHLNNYNVIIGSYGKNGSRGKVYIKSIE